MTRTHAISLDRLAWLDGLTLTSGSHRRRADGACAMEAAAYVAGERWSDHPARVSSVIGAFLRSWNDGLDDETRQILKPVIPRVIGTRTTEADEQRRAWLAVDWLVRAFAPAWLDLAGLTEDATRLRGLAVLRSRSSVTVALPIIETAQKNAAAAGVAAGDAARVAARDAARDALASTVTLLQTSALELLDRMILVGREDGAR